ncbi:protein of unknown function [Pseudodesulfovibrio piezophilus C1TLV30]|uniref:Uncharacterized protein n=1 Tax=Pseudodesulfovibrio piezophilus (strain DSM 21447 / JCM 15486 / C1TLV30) TaxID=1322246 RepID=M1WKL7_PSEP2|nr:protein of unknown function [Pseudodesulfovibrio piezophilus C1TLV30]
MSDELGSRFVTMDTLLVALGDDWKFSRRISVGVPMIRVELLVEPEEVLVVETVVEDCSTAHPWRAYPCGSTKYPSLSKRKLPARV